MLAGTFAQKLRRLNPRLRIAAGDRQHPAGLYMMVGGEEETICGLDYDDVPQRVVISAETGRIVKSGWQRVLQILINRKLATKDAVLKQFPTFSRTKLPPIVVGTTKPDVAAEIKKTFMARFDPDVDAPRLKKDEIMDFAKAIRK
jgi:hypothetical protein